MREWQEDQPTDLVDLLDVDLETRIVTFFFLLRFGVIASEVLRFSLRDAVKCGGYIVTPTCALLLLLGNRRARTRLVDLSRDSCKISNEP